jgi:SAM-dependent methyltransferase
MIEVGCGRGEFAERLLDEGIEVVAVDQSPRMVELTLARGVDSRVGDVQALSFDSQTFDAAVANFMLYHVPDLDRALSELARVLQPGGRLVATTNGVRQLAELWELVGRDLSDRQRLFMRETGEAMLRRHFTHVRRMDLDSTVELTAEDMRDYIAHSVAHKHLSERVPAFEGTCVVTASSAVFVATT